MSSRCDQAATNTHQQAGIFSNDTTPVQEGYWITFVTVGAEV